MNIILLGAPGAGKGTVAELVKEMRPVTHISTGDIFRKNIGEGTELGKLAKGYIDKGELVPDDVTIAMLFDRMNQGNCENGFMLDGFPRNLAQAQALDAALEAQRKAVDLVLFVDLDGEEIVRRLSGRRVCGQCGASYHTEVKPTAKEGVCDACGGEVIRRSDDEEATIRKRLTTFEENTRPVLDFYDAKGSVKKLDNGGSIDETRARLEALLK